MFAPSTYRRDQSHGSPILHATPAILRQMNIPRRLVKHSDPACEQASSTAPTATVIGPDGQLPASVSGYVVKLWTSIRIAFSDALTLWSEPTR